MFVSKARAYLREEREGEGDEEGNSERGER
jgi:hypothetical protein